MATTGSMGSTSSAHSSQSSLSPSRSGDEGSGGGASGGGENYWRERCQTLEASLVKFKQQAARIRELLAEKMQEHEQRTLEAEKRAEDAEETIRELEERLSSCGGWSSTHSSPKPLDGPQRLAQLDMECKNKEQEIANLQSQLAEQKSRRLQEAKLVEEKSIKIKEWVTKRIKELETENQYMKTENNSLRGQVDTLRERLQALPVSMTKEIYRRSVQSSIASSRPDSTVSTDLSPPIPKRPSSSILETLRQERELDHLHQDITSDLSPDLDEQMGDGVLEADYQEIDEDHESKYEPKRSAGPPQVRIERKVFPHPRLQASSMVSSTNGSEEMLDRTDSLSAARQAVPNLTLPRGGRLTSTSTNNTETTDTRTPVSLTPKSPPSPLTPYLPDPPPNSPSPVCPLSTANPDHTVSALATLPRRGKKDPAAQKFFPPHMRDYGALTIDRRLRKGGEFDRSQSERGRARPKPPTPPMRRLPSWENRIYAIANKGLRVPDAGSHIKRESSYPVTDGLYTDRMYEALTVPVFTTLKGRAAQIRSTPFTGDSSSDSSDNDDAVPASVATTTSVRSSVNEAVMSVAGPCGTKTTNSISVRKQVVNQTQTSSGATKRGVSSHSITSETSSDYAFPPEDEISIQTDSSDNSEPEHKLLKCSASHNLKKDSLEKCGYLTKLGGKVKNWRRRWFVLKHGELFYYKNPNDLAGKPQGYIALDGHTRIGKTESVLTFEIITCKKTYYLTADSTEDMEHWIRVLQNVLKKQAADKVLDQGRTKEIVKGWLIKTKNGRSRRCWCVLMGKFFMYYKGPGDKTPLGQLPLREARVEEVDRSCDSESDSEDTALPDYTLAIWPATQGPTYLMVPTKHEKDSWLYHLTVASGGGSGKVGSECEQLISKLMEVDGDPGSVYWKYPILLHSKEPLQEPLTTLPSEDLQQKALQLFKSCHSFTNIAIESPQIDEHVRMAQSILSRCLKHPELQNELYCQLIKQTSRHPPQHRTGVQNLLLCGGSHSWFMCDSTPTSPTNSVADLTDSKFNPVTYVFIQAWQLLAMAISLFLPRQSILWYLKAHLQRNADPRSEVGKYAVFCQRALERAMHNGGREARPSRMEVMSILLRNPYHHSQPISIPVHFLNSTYQVVSFDGSTTVQEFLAALNKTINMRDSALSGFALFTDDPSGQELEHCLKGHLKLCDVISKWEQAYLRHTENKTRSDISKTLKLTYKNRLYFKTLSKSETEKERLLQVYQVNEEIIHGRFPLNRDLAVELASLMAQIEYGDFRAPGEFTLTHHRSGSGRTTPPQSQQQVNVVIERFYPRRYRDVSQDEMRFVEDVITEKWVALRGKNLQDCVRIYLTVARKWQFFGAKLFSAKVKNGESSSSQVWLAVQEDGISVLEYANLRSVSNYTYKQVVTFGGWRDDLMLVVSKESGGDKHHHAHSATDRLIFVLSKPKILEITMLMASYINSRGQHRSYQSQLSKAESQTDGYSQAGFGHGSQAPLMKLRDRTPDRQMPALYSKPFISSSMEV